MKQSSTFILKGVVVFIGLVVFTLCVLLLPAVFHKDNVDYLPILFIMYLSAVPFFFALYQALKLLNYIDTTRAFSTLSLVALKRIRSCALVISIFYAAVLPLLYIRVQEEDAPGLFAIGLIIVFASVVVATFVSVLQKLFQNAINIKSENDLTV